MWWWNLCKKIKIKIYLYPHGLDGEHLKGIEKKWLPWHHICWIWTIGIVSIQSSSDVFWGIFPASLLKLYLHLTQKHQRASTVIRDVWDAGTLSTESGATFHRVIQLHHCNDETTMDEMDLSCFSVFTWWKFIRCAKTCSLHTGRRSGERNTSWFP